MFRQEEIGKDASGLVVELRVHGVGGTPPEALLDVPYTKLTGGDLNAGFFRSPVWIPVEEPSRALEGYSWGGLTSRTRARALWILLLPFALVNLAGWMFRHGGDAIRSDDRSRSRMEDVALAGIRLFAWIVTIGAWVYVGVIALDLVAYQCGVRAGCVAGRWWLWPWQQSWIIEKPARSLALGATLAFVSVLGIALLTFQSQKRTHPDPLMTERFDDISDPAWKVSLLRWRSVWFSPHVAHRLGLTHTAGALAAIGFILARVLQESASTSIADWFSTAFLVLLIVGAALTVRLDGVCSKWHMGLFLVTSGLALAILSWSFFGANIEARELVAPGARNLAGWTNIAVIALILILLALHSVLWRQHKPQGMSDWPGLLVPIILLVSASSLINSVGSGVLIRVADLLGDATAVSRATVPRGNQIIYSDVVGGTAVSMLAALVLAAVILLVVWLVAKKHAPSVKEIASRYRNEKEDPEDWPDPNDPSDRAWAERVSRAESYASITDQASLVLVGTGVVMGVSFLAVFVRAGLSAEAAAGRLLPEFHEPASYVLGLLPLGAVLLINRLYRSQGLRRGIGTIWDVATFWPRWFHPWAPPSYGERAVPQLRARIRVITEAAPLILSAHSQGTVIAVAALATMIDDPPPSRLDKVTLLTHGSPLRRLYTRFFPEYLDQRLFEAIHNCLKRTADGDLSTNPTTTWYNLHRRTDFIGGPVFEPVIAGVEDRSVLDPETPRAPAEGEQPPPIRGHSDYYRQSEYRNILFDIIGREPQPSRSPDESSS